MLIKRYFSEFQEIKLRGSGGFASVFEVLNKLDDNTYAIKKIPLSMSKMKQNFNRILEKVLREVKFLARISHPNIIRYYNSWIELKSSSSGSDDYSDNFIDPINEDSEIQAENERFEKSFEIMWDLSESEGDYSRNIVPAQRKYAKSFGNSEEFDSISEIMIFIQMELCDETLEQYLERRNASLFELKRHFGSSEQFQTAKKAYLKQAIHIFHQIISGLLFIHNNCFMVHRDLKPSNIFINKNMHVKLGDFGLAKQLQPFSLNSKEIGFSPPSMILKKLRSEILLKNQPSNCGTYVYASPEQLKEFGDFDQRADIYSLGVIALRLFHPMATIMEFFDVLKDIKGMRLMTDEKKELSEILFRMVSEKPSERPSLQEIEESFDKILDEDISKSYFQYKNLGMNLVRSEGNSGDFQDKWLKIIEKKLYVFGGVNEKKAEKVYNLDECNIVMDRDFITIEHPFQFGCNIKANGKQGIKTENLFKSFQELFENRSDLINFCYLPNKML